MLTSCADCHVAIRGLLRLIVKMAGKKLTVRRMALIMLYSITDKFQDSDKEALKEGTQAVVLAIARMSKLSGCGSPSMCAVFAIDCTSAFLRWNTLVIIVIQP